MQKYEYHVEEMFPVNEQVLNQLAGDGYRLAFVVPGTFAKRMTYVFEKELQPAGETRSS